MKKAKFQQAEETFANGAIDVMACIQEVCGERVILRCRDAGVWAGRLLAIGVEEGVTLAILIEARRIWNWVAAENPKDSFTISGLALNGVPAGSKIGAQQPWVPISGWCEVHPVTEKCEATIWDDPKPE